MKDKKALPWFFARYALITVGCVIYSLGVALFLDANSLAAGGVTGVAILISDLLDGVFPINAGMLIMIINVPLIIVSAFFFGKRFTLSTLYSTALSSLLVYVFEQHAFKDMPPLTENLMFSAIAGGALFGAGLGLIFRMGSSTGGSDIVVKLLRKKFRHIKTGIISMSLDVVVVCASAIVNRNFDLTFCTLLSIGVFTLFFDWVLYGGNSAKLVHIITTSGKAEKICVGILRELDIGATYVDGEGAYTGGSKRIIMCAVRNYLYPRLRDIVKETDPDAFMIVSSANEIYGEGYKPHGGEEL